MRKYRIHRNTYYTTDIFEAPPYASLTETHSTWSVQMRILGFLWITIREFDFDSEEVSKRFATRLLREIEKF